MLSSEQIDQMIKEAMEQLDKNNQIFDQLKEVLYKHANELGQTSAESKQAAQKMFTQKQQELEVESVNQQYALSLQNQASKSRFSSHSRRRNMI